MPVKETPQGCKTREALTVLRADFPCLTYPGLMSAIRNDKIPPPGKDISGDFVWTDEDIGRARAALACDRRLKANRPPRTPNGKGAA